MHAISRKTAILLVATASAFAAGSGMAATTIPTCQALEDKCVKHVAAIESRKPADDGVDRPQMTTTECYDSYHAAEATGVWPAHVPFNFAVTCTK